MEVAIRYIEALTPLVQSIVWPLFLFFLVLWLRKPIRSFLAGVSELKIKAAGVEASAITPREKIKAAALLGVASAKEAKDPNQEVDTSGIADAVEGFAEKSQVRGPARILWVDDTPSNNYLFREAFEQLSIEFGIARSTEEALQKLSVGHYDLIISDMGRPPDLRAGYTLLDNLREDENEIPFVIFAGSRAPEHQKEAVAHGAIGCTNRSDELFVLVSQGLVLASC